MTFCCQLVSVAACSMPATCQSACYLQHASNLSACLLPAACQLSASLPATCSMPAICQSACYLQHASNLSACLLPTACQLPVDLLRKLPSCMLLCGTQLLPTCIYFCFLNVSRIHAACMPPTASQPAKLPVSLPSYLPNCHAPSLPCWKLFLANLCQNISIEMDYNLTSANRIF